MIKTFCEQCLRAVEVPLVPGSTVKCPDCGSDIEPERPVDAPLIDMNPRNPLGLTKLSAPPHVNATTARSMTDEAQQLIKIESTLRHISNNVHAIYVILIFWTIISVLAGFVYSINN